jgi:hypothetical protein
LTNGFGEKKISALPSKNKVADENNLVQKGKFSSATLFLEGSALNFYSPKKKTLLGLAQVCSEPILELQQ